MSIDGTDFKINEPTPFSSKWYSHKLKHAGLRYEVGVCLQTGWIVWTNGPYRPGQWPDLPISRDGLTDALDDDELFLADGTYRDGHGWADTPTGLNNADQRMKAKARARHERVNGLLKNFHCLRDCFRHHRTKHGRVFMACANIVQARSSWRTLLSECIMMIITTTKLLLLLLAPLRCSSLCLLSFLLCVLPEVHENNSLIPGRSTVRDEDPAQPFFEPSPSLLGRSMMMVLGVVQR